MAPSYSLRKLRTGFTLIELMITVAVIGILAAIAYPSYTQYVQRSNRSAAQAQMMEIANRQQQFFFANRRYATRTELEAGGYALPSNLTSRYGYTIDIGTGAVPSFTVTFTPVTGGPQVSDGALSLDSAGVKTPASKW
jgi:type IV pilus assembly protein PilE